MQHTAQQDHIAHYQQCRERAAHWLDDIADELAQKYGYSSYSIQICAPLIDLITAHIMMVDATARLGGPDAIAYGAHESDAALMKKVGRLILDDGQRLFEPAEIALGRHKLPQREQSQIYSAWIESREKQDAKPRLHSITDKLAKRGRKQSYAALDRFVHKPQRFW